MRVFKYGESGISPRVALRISTLGASDPIRSLFVRILEIHNRTKRAHWFSTRDLQKETSAGLHDSRSVPPPGMKFMLRLLRSGGISAAYAVGTTLERFVSPSNHVSTSFILHHYLDPLVAETDAARVFLSRFVRGIPRTGPATPVLNFLGNITLPQPLT